MPTIEETQADELFAKKDIFSEMGAGFAGLSDPDSHHTQQIDISHLSGMSKAMAGLICSQQSPDEDGLHMTRGSFPNAAPCQDPAYSQPAHLRNPVIYPRINPVDLIDLPLAWADSDSASRTEVHQSVGEDQLEVNSEPMRKLSNTGDAVKSAEVQRNSHDKALARLLATSLHLTGTSRPVHVVVGC